MVGASAFQTIFVLLQGEFHNTNSLFFFNRLIGNPCGHRYVKLYLMCWDDCFGFKIGGLHILAV